MEITYLGHSGFYISGKNIKIVIDPFLTNNPMAKHNPRDLDNNFIIISHGHSDHLGDAVEIAKEFNSTVITNFEIANYFTSMGCKAHGIQVGGRRQFGDLGIKLTNALHSSSMGAYPAVYMGPACGIILQIDGITIYHAGDTGLFGDMELIGRLNNIDIALLPIGDNYTMGPEDAVEAVKMIKPKVVIPMHYNTWELIAQDPNEFKDKVEKKTISRVEIMSPGESMTIVNE